MTIKQESQQTTALPTKCGCGGDIVEGVGCQQYSKSDDFILAIDSDLMVRVAELGFGQSVYAASEDAMMSLHLQHNGFSPQQAGAILLVRHSA